MVFKLGKIGHVYCSHYWTGTHGLELLPSMQLVYYTYYLHLTFSFLHMRVWVIFRIREEKSNEGC